MTRINKFVLSTLTIAGIGVILGTAQPAGAQNCCAYHRAQSRNAYYWMGKRYNSWSAVRRRITGAVAPGSYYSVGKGRNRRYYGHRNLPGLWGYNTRSEYQTNLNMALTFGGR